MADFTAITAAEIQGGKPATGTGGTLEKVKDDLDYLYSLIGTLASRNIRNGDFEVLTGTDPVDWTVGTYTGGTASIDTSSQRHGLNCMKFVHPSGASNGGGYVTSDYHEIGPDFRAMIEQSFWASNAGVHITVEVEYFTSAKVSISTQTLYDASSGNPTSAPSIPQLYGLVIPSTARYFKYTFIGGDPDTDPGVSTNIFLDFVRLVNTPPFAAGDVPVSQGSGEFNTSLTAYALASRLTSSVIMSVAGPSCEIQIDRPGTLRFNWEMKTAGSWTAYAKVYRNGSAVGSEKTTTSATYVPKQDDISGWERGDLAQLYFYINNGSGTAYVQEFNACSDIAVETVNTY